MSPLQEGSGKDLVAAIESAPKALVFISVPWSGPERSARKLFRAAVDQLDSRFPQNAFSYFRLEVDEDAIAQEWLSAIGHLHLALLGAGSLLWLQSGKVIDYEINANFIGIKGIVDRTKVLWNVL